jgi:hypothetical protein
MHLIENNVPPAGARARENGDWLRSVAEVPVPDFRLMSAVGLAKEDASALWLIVHQCMYNRL